jgi:surface antigen
MAPHRLRIASLAATLLLLALSPGAPARAQPQPNSSYGTDQRYCDRSTLSQVLSTSKGNIVGSAAGGAAGGLVGSQFGKSSGKSLMTVLGVVGGALAGGAVGRSMDDTDQNCIGETLQHAPANQPVAWQNPGNGSSYWVTPVQDRRGPNGEVCRDYITDAVVDGRQQQLRNTACEQANGSWVPVAKEDLQPTRPPSPQPDATVSSDTILKVQQRLRAEGFYVRDNIDGVWGPRTALALRNFQRAHGLNATGQLDLDTLAALKLSSG